ncbi:MAG TPA: hypothetical protein VHC90_17910 [Bryobacteraceae bacterium]|nr:hypothetical protein [Bryobacteraceae bacterium]
MAGSWAELKIPESDFDIRALHAALDARRVESGLSWAAVARAVSRADERGGDHPIAASTISGLKDKRWGVEGDGVLQMLLWLDRTPESFVPGHPGADHPEARLPRAGVPAILRFDVPGIYAKIETQRNARRLTWKEAACDIGGFFNAESLRSLSRGKRIAFPGVMRLARWLHCPAAALTRMAPR